MTTSTYSIATARNQFTSLIRQAERGMKPIHITRRGQHVAVILSANEHRRLVAHQPQTDFWQAYLEYQERWKDVEMDIDDDVWVDLRDNTIPSEVNVWQ